VIPSTYRMSVGVDRQHSQGQMLALVHAMRERLPDGS
jgi:hypothetical protein